ncbi:MAG: TolC family protein [Acidobacteria bacterium]|nr:MAG: TolC family protein [Acidobacteriota bacterium]
MEPASIRMEMTAISRFAFGVLLAIVLACGRDAYAQDRLSLLSAIDLALATHPDVVGTRAAVREAEQRVTQARAGFFPKIDFTQSWQRGNQPVFVFGSLLAQRQFAEADFAIQQLNHPAPITNARSAFSLEYALFDGGRTRAAARAATLETSVARAVERQTRNDLALATTRAYGRALGADAERQAAVAAVATAEEDARTAEARRDAGTVTEADVLAMQAHLAEMRARAIDAAAEERIARADLNRLMNRPLETAMVLEQAPIAAGAASGQAASAQKPGEGRPELEQAALRVDLANAARARVRGALLPEIAVQGGYEWNDGQRGGPASAWLTGVAVRVNLFSGGATAARLREAAYAADRARAEQERAAAAVRLEVLTAIERLAAARARDAVGRAAVVQARESQRIIRDRFEVGLTPASEAIRAATAVLDAEAQRVRAVVDVMVGEAELRRAVGDEEVRP